MHDRVEDLRLEESLHALPVGHVQLLEAEAGLPLEPAEAVAFTLSEGLPRTMDRVRAFSWEHGLLPDGPQGIDTIGIAFPDGSVLGDPDNVTLRFTEDYMAMAADGML